jgi:hypothetical protein
MYCIAPRFGDAGLLGDRAGVGNAACVLRELKSRTCMYIKWTESLSFFNLNGMYVDGLCLRFFCET